MLKLLSAQIGSVDNLFVLHHSMDVGTFKTKHLFQNPMSVPREVLIYQVTQILGVKLQSLQRIFRNVLFLLNIEVGFKL